MKTAHVRPLGGRKLRLPERPREILPDAGRTVVLSDYWLARIRDGDAEIVAPEAKATPAAVSRRASRPATTPKED